MSKIKELEERRAQITEQMTTITTAAEQRSEGLTDEDHKAFEKLEKERAKVDADLRVYKALEAEDMRKAQTAAEERKADATAEVEERAFFNALRKEMTTEDRAALTMENSQILVPNTIQRDILLGIQGSFGILSVIDLQFTDNAGTMTFPYLAGPLTLQKVAIGATETNGSVAFKGVSLSAFDFKLPAIPISETLLAGADADVRAALVALFTEYITQGLSDKVINSGDDNKDFKAILTTLDNNAKAAESDSLTYTDLVNLKSKVKAPYNQKGRASFVMNSSTKDALLGLVDKQGRPLYIESMSADVSDKLFGYPVVIDDAMPEIGAGSKVLLFGDFKAYKARIVRGVRVKTYDESKYSEQGCIGMQAFVTGDGRLVYESGKIEPLAALEMATA